MVCEADTSVKYSKGEYNKIKDGEQWIRLSEGCPNKCLFCRESWENPTPKVFEIPEIKTNNVKILDMNLLSHIEALEIIKELGRRRINNKVIYYELLCGIDYRFLTQDLATALKQARFKNIRLAWDHEFTLQKKIKEKTRLLIMAGYDPQLITIFMICNWRVSYKDNLRKLDLCKIWGFKAADCYFDNQLSPNIKPVFWKEEEIKDFRRRVRKHNHLVRFKIDPEEN